MRPPTVSWTQNLLVYAHIGDLHVVDRTMHNYSDLTSIIDDLNAIGETLDFVYLPGDNADNGTDEQYRLVAEALRTMRFPVHAITGDHDMEGGSLQPFYRSLSARLLPYTQTVRGVDCVFLDMSGEGRGGPDFRLSSTQTDHLRSAIDAARAARRQVAVFMHTYPADLSDGAETAAVRALLADPAVRIVDMGHTHYNELANDGRTVFAATRSTGQNEEGPAGYSVTTVDGDNIGWRFKTLDDAAPFVLITAPADRRLRTSQNESGDRVAIHVVVLGAQDVERCEWRGAGDEWRPMARTGDGRGFEAFADATHQMADRLEVRAVDASGCVGTDVIELADTDVHTFVGDGSDKDTIGAWPERHLFGTQLGPNRNGRKW